MGLIIHFYNLFYQTASVVIVAVKSVDLREVPPSPLVFRDAIFRFKFINRQKNFVFIVSRILRYGTGGRSGLSFWQEQNLYGRLTTGLNRLDPAANDVTVSG